MNSKLSNVSIISNEKHCRHGDGQVFIFFFFSQKFIIKCLHRCNQVVPIMQLGCSSRLQHGLTLFLFTEICYKMLAQMQPGCSHIATRLLLKVTTWSYPSIATGSYQFQWIYANCNGPCFDM